MNGVFSEVGKGRFHLHPKVLGLSEEESEAIQKLSQRPDAIDFISREHFIQASMVKPFQDEIDRTKVFMILCDDGKDYVKKGRLLELIWLKVTFHGYGVRPFSLSRKQLK